MLGSMKHQQEWIHLVMGSTEGMNARFMAAAIDGNSSEMICVRVGMYKWLRGEQNVTDLMRRECLALPALPRPSTPSNRFPDVKEDGNSTMSRYTHKRGAEKSSAGEGRREDVSSDCNSDKLS